MVSEPFPLAAADLELLERVAARIVALRLEVPAILALESAQPLALLAGQALVFFEPLLQVVLPGPEVRRFAALVERRDALEHLTRRIEALTDERRAASPRAGRR
jgi:hypothetical protein